MMRKENDYIFRPSKNELVKAKQRRMERWVALEIKSCSREDQLERMKADIEVFEAMKIVKERANEYVKNLKNQRFN